jgi:hypothetical protein
MNQKRSYFGCLISFRERSNDILSLTSALKPFWPYKLDLSFDAASTADNTTPKPCSPGPINMNLIYKNYENEITVTFHFTCSLKILSNLNVIMPIFFAIYRFLFGFQKWFFKINIFLNKI